MKLTMQLAGQRFAVRLSEAVSLAIPLHFNGPQPNHFGAATAQAKPMQAGDWVGDTRRGGSCNVPELSLNPHCNGTHTESVSHIVNELHSINRSARDLLVPATLISVNPVAANQCSDHYTPVLAPADQVITQVTLQRALDGIGNDWLAALVVRTLPNGRDKQTARYGDSHQPPFFTREAMQYLRLRGVQHLLVDFPSLDKMHDNGHLTAHHLFWEVAEDSHGPAPTAALQRTVTEMVFVPDSLRDGLYLLNLQLPAFELDAAPSRPFLLPLEPDHA
ncbi:cyclase family protein [Permianibacter sp. IMCC34836]|uniref:cyclase family protein n=1 Tax=Permianibacter fluminis TaxID=2738515 RepID=UPI0015544F2A|nr:cyclase family protein [Permianibacter fluminis]NQD39072.1 cyclase family protein [Permianibacter fluminis]